MSCCKKNRCFCLMLTLFRWPLITENRHLLRDPELSTVTRNCQIYIMPLDTLKTGIYKLKDFINYIKVKRNNLLNSIYSSVSPDFRFKETPYVNFFTDPELSSSLYMTYYMAVNDELISYSDTIILILWSNNLKNKTVQGYFDYKSVATLSRHAPLFCHDARYTTCTTVSIHLKNVNMFPTDRTFSKRHLLTQLPQKNKHTMRETEPFLALQSVFTFS